MKDDSAWWPLQLRRGTYSQYAMFTIGNKDVVVHVGHTRAAPGSFYVYRIYVDAENQLLTDDLLAVRAFLMNLAYPESNDDDLHADLR